MSNVEASAQVTGATGATTRRRNVQSVYRAGPGVYHIVFPVDRNIRTAEYHMDVTPIGAVARIAQLGNPGGVAPPGGANAPAGALSVQVNTFDAAGAAADADFLFAASRV